MKYKSLFYVHLNKFVIYMHGAPFIFWIKIHKIKNIEYSEWIMVLKDLNVLYI